jgi:UDP-N-acetylglucosamine--N-acetylmuramyl-(pentapeptide) pyrophosphoryl-undecaprenol N-acetylglucosamine transferase
MKILIMAGGTGGHVFPALAVAQALRDRGHEIVWMGAPDSFEARVVPQHAIPLEFVRVSGLRGKGVLKLLWAPLILCRALLQAMAALRRQRPQVVLGMGGFASGPGGVAAWLLRRPLLIHEQNAVAGLTNRALSWLACHTLQAFPGTFRSAGALTVGNPVRTALTGLPHPAERLAHRSGPLRVLVIGGSQGARALNEKMPAALRQMAPEQRPEVRHQAGRTLEIAQAAYAQSGVTARIDAFIEDMADAYAWADLVVCRAGASTIAELTAVGCAAVLVPFPAAVDDHQTRNGEYLVRAGAALLMPERELSATTLAGVLTSLAADLARLLAMATAARALAQPAAVDEIIRRVEQAGAVA